MYFPPFGSSKATTVASFDSLVSPDDLFHFGKLDPEAPDLNLGILSADDLDISVRKISGNITGMIQHFIAFRIIINVLRIYLCRFLRLIEIPPRNLEA